MARRIIEPITIRRRPSHECPKCGGTVHRVSRTALQRVLVVFIPSKRYRCADPACRWEGLLRSRQFERERGDHLGNAVRALAGNALALLGILTAVAIGLFLLWVLLR